jgi:hypothetical protein
MDDLENDFGRLAAIGPDLAQILCGIAPLSCVNSPSHHTKVSTPWSCGNSRAAAFPRLRPKIAGETRKTQLIVTVESQLGVSGADSTSC